MSARPSPVRARVGAASLAALAVLVSFGTSPAAAAPATYDEP